MPTNTGPKQLEPKQQSAVDGEGALRVPSIQGEWVHSIQLGIHWCDHQTAMDSSKPVATQITLFKFSGR